MRKIIEADFPKVLPSHRKVPAPDLKNQSPLPLRSTRLAALKVVRRKDAKQNSDMLHARLLPQPLPAPTRSEGPATPVPKQITTMRNYAPPANISRQKVSTASPIGSPDRRSETIPSSAAEVTCSSPGHRRSLNHNRPLGNMKVTASTNAKQPLPHRFHLNRCTCTVSLRIVPLSYVIRYPIQPPPFVNHMKLQ